MPASGSVAALAGEAAVRCRDDHRIAVERVLRVQLVDLVGREIGRDHRALGLVLDVGAEVPGHRLQPRHRVFGCPRLDLVVGVLQPEHRVLERRVGAGVVGEVGVHPGGVGVVVRRDRRVERLDLLRRDLAPAERPQELVGRQLRLPEQLREATARDVPAEVHLPEPILRVDVPLREEEVVGVASGDRRDAEHIALHVDVVAETLDRNGALELRERPLDRAHDEPCHDQRDHDEPGDDAEHRDADDAADRSPAGRVVLNDRRGSSVELRH